MKSSFKLRSVWIATVCGTIFSGCIGAASGATFTTGAIADAFVATGPSGGLSGSNFGAAGALAIAASGLPNGPFQTVMQFDLSAARSAFDSQFGPGTWSVQSATLQLNATPHTNPIFNDPAAGMFNISLMQNNSWIEGTGTGGSPTTDGISYNSLQTVYINNALDQALGTFNFAGGTSGTANYALGLTQGLTNGLATGAHLSLRLYAADNTVSYLFASRTGGSAPELILTVVPEPGTIGLWLTGAGILVAARMGRLR